VNTVSYFNPILEMILIGHTLISGEAETGHASIYIYIRLYIMHYKNITLQNA